MCLLLPGVYSGLVRCRRVRGVHREPGTFESFSGFIPKHLYNISPWKCCTLKSSIYSRQSNSVLWNVSGEVSTVITHHVCTSSGPVSGQCSRQIITGITYLKVISQIVNFEFRLTFNGILIPLFNDLAWTMLILFTFAVTARGFASWTTSLHANRCRYFFICPPFPTWTRVMGTDFQIENWYTRKYVIKTVATH